MPGLGGIYKIQSLIKPNRCYIGSSYNIPKRWTQHLSKLKCNNHPSHKLQNHYNKYGKNDLVFSILIGCEKEDLIITEQFFLDSYNPWFNNRPKAESNSGHKYTEKQKANLRKVRKQKAHPMLGKHHTEESKQKNRDAHRFIQKGKDAPNFGRSPSIETREKLRKANLGKHHTEVSKQKNRESQIRIGNRPPSAKGKSPWNKGLKNPEGIKGKITKLKIA